ncbi:MAG: aspartate--tRNA(Asn) ligase [Treponema sp.]|jgi:nondiscriminating aspartyl-tRNA synthetase|nr:aspartate--tRNA(Asn) ligase [Treponema sp.]
MRVLAKDILAGTVTGEPEQSSGELRSVEVSGWVHRIRELGGITFVILRDRSGVLQLVLSDLNGSADTAAASEKPDLTLESVIRARGIPAPNEKAPGGTELRVSSLEVISRAAPDLPYQVNRDAEKTGLESILDNRALSLRNPKIRSIFKVQAAIIEAFAAYLRSRDFTEIKTSKLVAGGTEGGTELFEVKYFDRKVYLAQSPQFYKETLVASGLERVFEIAPAYRAEKHDTPRHLNEYVSLDVEMGFIDSEKELIELEKGVLAHVFENVLCKNGNDVAAWNSTVPDPALVAKAPTIPYDEAMKIATEEAAKSKGGGGKIFDINPEAERFLCAWAGREHGIELIFVNQFPRRHRPFYTYPLDLGDGKAASTMSFDCLFRGLEITTGGKRQHDYNAFLEVLPRFGLKPEDMENYLALLKYGCPPHGGFAIGCERLTQKILGLANVKEASLFPRDRKRVTP